MKIYKRLILLVSLGMLLIMSITILSLQNLSSFFSNTTTEIGAIGGEVRRIWDLERKLDDISRSARNYGESGSAGERVLFDAARADVKRILSERTGSDRERFDREYLDSLATDFFDQEKKAIALFSLTRPADRDRAAARNLLAGIKALHTRMESDIDRYKDKSIAESNMLTARLRSSELRIDALLAVILFISIAFLFGFGVYLYRKVSVPLADLWAGTEAISGGNLDYRIDIHGEDDIVMLAERFNEMARKLKESYADLEEKLLARTRELAALDAVALTLGQSGSLEHVLGKSLGKIIESLEGMQPRGGIFLCEQDGERLRLVTHCGLTPEFVKREETIRMGECLCGHVARTGELLFSEHSCGDSRHTSAATEEDHSHIILPVKSRGIVLGVIFLYPEKDFQLKPSDIQLLDSIGAQLGLAVENFRFYGEVKESSEKYWDLFENSRDIVCTVDLQGRFTAINKAAEKFLGSSKIELIGGNILEFMTEEGSAIVKRALAGSRVSPRELREFEIVRKDGKRSHLNIIARLMSKNRSATGFQISARDVSEQKRLREMLVKGERLSAIFEIGTAVRHEINNPLTTVIGNAELLLERYADTNDDLKKRLEVILNNGLRIAEIVKKLEGLKRDKAVEYLNGITMTDLKQG